MIMILSAIMIISAILISNIEKEITLCRKNKR